MIGTWRFAGAGLVALAAGALLGGLDLPGGAASRPQARPAPPAAAQQGEEDGGFSIVLTGPVESYLAGARTIAVEARLPAGDPLGQVDFFVDGRLACTTRAAPLACEVDFGPEIRSHTIVVRAETRRGRRARVSYVSRSGDVADSASGPIEVVPAVVRDAAGRPVDGLSVSDFALLENGVRRPIVHFDSEPAPVSVAVLLQAPAGSPAGDAAPLRPSLLRGAGLLAEALPWHHALALLDGVPVDTAGDAAAAAGPRFSFDRGEFARWLRLVGTDGRPGRPDPLAALLSSAAEGLRARRGARALVLLVASLPPDDPPAVVKPQAPAPPPPVPAVPPPAPEGEVDGAPAPDPAEPAAPPAPPAAESAAPPVRAVARRDEALREALEALRSSRVTLHVVALETHGGARETALRRAAAETGGEFHVPADAQAIEAACRRISESFLHRYLISYLPDGPPLPAWRSIDVRVTRPDLTVQAPTGYTGPQDPARPASKEAP